MHFSDSETNHYVAVAEDAPSSRRAGWSGIIAAGATFLAAAAMIAVVASSFSPAVPSALQQRLGGWSAAGHGLGMTTQLDDTDDIAKMKASVHAAAQIKKSAISSQHLPGSAPTGDASTSGPRGRAPVAIDPTLFKAGPYVIASVLVAICISFTYCACSTQPSSMSGKYDMTGRGRR